MKKGYYIVILCFASFFGSTAQDIHYSNYANVPIYINPSLVGQISGDARLILNYRNQWSSITSPYRTYSVYSDFNVSGTSTKKLSAGVFINKDNAGDLNFSKSIANLGVAYNILLDEHNFISAGIKGGVIQTIVNLQNGNARWVDQYSADGYNESSPTTGNVIGVSEYQADFSAGVSWMYKVNDRNMVSNDNRHYRLGLSVFHVNVPKESTMNSSTNRLYAKYIVHGDAKIGFDYSNIHLLPSMYLFKQGPNLTATTGLMISYKLKEASKYTGIHKSYNLLIGCNYRWRDAIMPNVAIHTSNFRFNLSYDVNISKLVAVSRARGGIEISLQYILQKSTKTIKTK